MNNGSIVAVFIVVVVLIGAGLFFVNQHANDAAGTPEQPSASSTAPSTATGDMTGQPTSAYTVKLMNGSFSPATLTVPVGTTVTFVNQSSEDMWIASDDHPDHTDYDGTTRDEHCAPGYAGATPLDECGTGNTYTFTFTKAGTWGYHNHADHDEKGTIVVQ
jgi:plastocyanin